jgi:CBS domain-containing protein
MTKNPTFVAGDTLAIEALDKMVQVAVLSFYLSAAAAAMLLEMSAGYNVLVSEKDSGI